MEVQVLIRIKLRAGVGSPRRMRRNTCWNTWWKSSCSHQPQWTGILPGPWLEDAEGFALTMGANLALN